MQAAIQIPDEVICAVNKLLVKRHAASTIFIYIDDIIDEANKFFADAGKEVPERNTYFENNFLDIEHLYEANGWKSVRYDRPHYSDSYKPRFIFIK